MDDDPLIVPGHEFPRVREHTATVAVSVVSPVSPVVAEHVDHAIVEFQDRHVQSGDHQVFVVARVGDDRRAARGPGQILEEPSAFHLEFGPIARLIELRIFHGPASVDRIEIERRRARVGRSVGPRGHAEPRRCVEGHVVVEELAEERDAGRVRRVVDVVRAEVGFRDEADGPHFERVLGVEQAAGRSHFFQGAAHVRRRLRKRRESIEEPHEAVRPRPIRTAELACGISRPQHRCAGRASSGANTGQEASSADACGRRARGCRILKVQLCKLFPVSWSESHGFPLS